jgi:hypothetical protein
MFKPASSNADNESTDSNVSDCCCTVTFRRFFMTRKWTIRKNETDHCISGFLRISLLHRRYLGLLMDSSRRTCFRHSSDSVFCTDCMKDHMDLYLHGQPPCIYLTLSCELGFSTYSILHDPLPIISDDYSILP